MGLRVLFAASEALPFAKTGGLADVAHALPVALTREGIELVLVCPAYRGTLERLRHRAVLTTMQVHGQRFTIWEGHPEGEPLRVWLVECPGLFDRDGSPYQDIAGVDHPDNAWRFGSFCQAVARLASGEGSGQRADIVHLNDWQTGLVPLWLPRAGGPCTIFTIHNLAYQGVFPRDEFDALGVPADLWHMDGIEYYGNGSFLKAGLTQCDWLTTVSPTYAREIQTADFGHGMDGLLRHRADRLSGILNGIDGRVWNPQTDTHLAAHYDRETVVTGKRANRLALCKQLRLPDRDVPLIGMVTRFAWQKGVDLVLAARAKLDELQLQIVVLGAGDPGLERQFRDWAKAQPERVAVRIGYDETLAHRIEAAADIFLMPSRYEPCGLNQMYSQRYGTVPVVRRVGGLADSVIDPADAAPDEATGICFGPADADSLAAAVTRALELYGGRQWHAMQQAGMRSDFTWHAAARHYLSLYAQVVSGS